MRCSRRAAIFFLTLLLLNFPYFLQAAGLPNMVMIEVKVVEVSDISGLQLGVRWEYERNTEPGSKVATGVANLFIPNFDVSKGSQGSYLHFDQVKIGRALLEAKLQALISEGKAKLLANPKITTIENKTAKIFSGDRIPYQTTKLVGSNVVLTTEFTDVGISLEVKPVVMENNYIQMDVRPEVSGITGHENIILADGKTYTLPVLSSRRAEATVLIKDGGTFALGGLYKNDMVKEMRKVPFLGSIPIAGIFFRYTSNITHKSELLIFITPHIIKPGEDVIIPQITEGMEREGGE